MTEKLSIVDKYFSLKKEGRINRMQFFARKITGAILGSIPIFIVIGCGIVGQNIGLIPKSNSEGSNLLNITLAILALFFILVYFYIGCINVCKRAHDFNHRGLGYNRMLYIGIYMVGVCIGILVMITTVVINGDTAQGASLGLIGGYVSLYIAWVITWGILQFRKGNPGNNQYGPAPTGKPLV